jgi:hypothetical protein
VFEEVGSIGVGDGAVEAREALNKSPDLAMLWKR